MDEFDPQRRDRPGDRRVGHVAPAHARPQPAHLWQQNTLRDALVAAITLDAFNRHADKLVMGNIAQVANVLQSLVLTEGERMVLTPTYHVFDLYQPHQGGTSVRTEFEAPAVSLRALANERRRCPGLTGSASVRATR